MHTTFRTKLLSSDPLCRCTAAPMHASACIQHRRHCIFVHRTQSGPLRPAALSPPFLSHTLSGNPECGEMRLSWTDTLHRSTIFKQRSRQHRYCTREMRPSRPVLQAAATRASLIQAPPPPLLLLHSITTSPPPMPLVWSIKPTTLSCIMFTSLPSLSTTSGSATQ